MKSTTEPPQIGRVNHNAIFLNSLSDKERKEFHRRKWLVAKQNTKGSLPPSELVELDDLTRKVKQMRMEKKLERALEAQSQAQRVVPPQNVAPQGERQELKAGRGRKFKDEPDMEAVVSPT